MSATISACGLYRYTLERRWSDRVGRVLWVMLNPSTADATTNDATIRRCIGFSHAWGYGALVVGNLYAFRATQPADLQKATDPIGPENDRYLREMTRTAALVIAAWGANAQPERAAVVTALLRHYGGIHTLGFTKGGQPRHPLRLPSTLKPEFWK
jgi:hypothetical protein